MDEKHCLYLGQGETTDGKKSEKLMPYYGNEAVCTIASPGSGKSWAMAIPNLLYWQGPAFVLDIKGELFDETGWFRSRKYGRVIRFNPDDPEGAAFNPFAFVDPKDKKSLWNNCQFFSNLIITKSDSKDPFWENNARDLLTAILAALYLDTEREEPFSFEDILDSLADRERLNDLSVILLDSDIRAAARAGKSVRELLRQEEESQSKLLHSFCMQAQSALGYLTGEHIVHATRRCDWQPEDLRQENATVYLDLRSGDIDDYCPLIRMILGVHYRELTKKLPQKEDAPILFLLDEMPQLGYMKVIEKMLDVGRGYGLKLWVFAQNKGQIEKAYGDANGFLSKCAQRAYMNPAGADADNLAQSLSDLLGMRKELRTGQKEPNVDPWELSGPDYEDKVIVISRGKKPCVLYKFFPKEHGTTKPIFAQKPKKSIE